MTIPWLATHMPRADGAQENDDQEPTPATEPGEKEQPEQPEPFEPAPDHDVIDRQQERADDGTIVEVTRYADGSTERREIGDDD